MEKVRKEVWLSKVVVGKLSLLAIEEGRSMKSYMESVLIERVSGDIKQVGNGTGIRMDVKDKPEEILVELGDLLVEVGRELSDEDNERKEEIEISGVKRKRHISSKEERKQDELNEIVKSVPTKAEMFREMNKKGKIY